MFRVYRVLNTKNGKSYIGITSRSVEARWLEHCSRARGTFRFSRLHAAIRKYGVDSFVVEEIASTSYEAEVRMLEGEFIHRFDTFRNGYNCNFGGAGFLNFPQHIRDKISAAQKGKVISAVTREKMAAAKRGDSRCADHFGAFTVKGNGNPKAKSYRIEFPDGVERVVTGWRAFCREHGLSQRHLRERGKTKGYKLLGTFNDYPLGE